MTGLEKNLSEASAQKYQTETKNEEYPTSIDETTERILVTTISAAIVAAPIIALAGKLLPELPIYKLYQYFPF